MGAARRELASRRGSARRGEVGGGGGFSRNQRWNLEAERNFLARVTPPFRQIFPLHTPVLTAPGADERARVRIFLWCRLAPSSSSRAARQDGSRCRGLRRGSHRAAVLQGKQPDADVRRAGGGDAVRAEHGGQRRGVRGRHPQRAVGPGSPSGGDHAPAQAQTRGLVRAGGRGDDGIERGGCRASAASRIGHHDDHARRAARAPRAPGARAGTRGRRAPGRGECLPRRLVPGKETHRGGARAGIGGFGGAALAPAGAHRAGAQVANARGLAAARRARWWTRRSAFRRT